MTTDKLSTFEALYTAATKSAPGWTKDLRSGAWSRFRERGFPTRKDEDFKYTSLRPLTDVEWTYAGSGAAVTVKPAFENSVLLTLNNGALQSDAVVDLPHGLKVTSLADLNETQSKLVADMIVNMRRERDHQFHAYGEAFVGRGVLVEVEKSAAIRNPIEIAHLSNGKANEAAFGSVFVNVATNAEVTLVERWVQANPVKALEGVWGYLHCDANAQVTHLKLHETSDQMVGMDFQKVDVHKDSRYFGLNLSGKHRFSRNEIDVLFAGEGGDVVIDGLYLGGDKDYVDHHTTLEHAVPRCRSRQYYKGILDGSSRGVFNGKVFVRRDAQQTNGQQLNKTLLLSRSAEMDTKPQLEIDADDVKCGHGAAIGQLDQDELFYLRSRGIDETAARNLLSQGFAIELLDREEFSAYRNELHQWLARRLG